MSARTLGKRLTVAIFTFGLVANSSLRADWTYTLGDHVNNTVLNNGATIGHSFWWDGSSKDSETGAGGGVKVADILSGMDTDIDLLAPLADTVINSNTLTIAELEAKSGACWMSGHFAGTTSTIECEKTGEDGGQWPPTDFPDKIGLPPGNTIPFGAAAFALAADNSTNSVGTAGVLDVNVSIDGQTVLPFGGARIPFDAGTSLPMLRRQLFNAIGAQSWPGDVRAEFDNAVPLLRSDSPFDISVAYRVSCRDAAGAEGDCAGQSPGLITGMAYQAFPENIADLNNDGSVDAGDAAVLFSNWGTSLGADVNQDGTVDGADAGVLFSVWTGDGVPNVSSSATALVPEPGLAVMLLPALLACVTRRRRRGNLAGR